MLVSQEDSVYEGVSDDGDSWDTRETPLGAKIIRAARAYDARMTSGQGARSPQEMVEDLRSELDQDSTAVFEALSRIVRQRKSQHAEVASPV
jgi:hypothetical protein